MVRGSNPGGSEIFRTCPDRPWGLPSLLYNRYRVLSVGKVWPGHEADPSNPSSAEVKNRVELYLYSPSGPLWPMKGWNLPGIESSNCEGENRKIKPLHFIIQGKYITVRFLGSNNLKVRVGFNFVSIFEKNEMGGACMGEGRGVHRILVGKPEGKRPLGRPRRRWEDNIKLDLQEVGGDCGDWMELAQDRDRWRALVSTVRNLRFQKCREFLD